MKCNHMIELFDSYLKGTATIDEAAMLEHHIATCETCRKQLELYRLYLTDINIENDFPVPSQLDAKIKYAVFQAKTKKKVPFWQNKRILSTATACALLFIVGILGTSHYSKMKEASQLPTPELMQMADFSLSKEHTEPVPPADDVPMLQQTPEPIADEVTDSNQIATKEISKPKTSKTEKTVPQPTKKQASTAKVVTDSKPKATAKPENKPKITTETPTTPKVITDTPGAPSSVDETPRVATEITQDNSTPIAESPKTDAPVSASAAAPASTSPQSTAAPEQSSAFAVRTVPQEQLAPAQDIVISKQWKEPILTNYPHEVITEDTYLVTITKTELEDVLGYSTNAHEEQTQLNLTFVTVSE